MVKKVALAFSGGLDTSWCVPHLSRCGFEVVTVTVGTGGEISSKQSELKARSKALGAASHLYVEAREAFFNEVIAFLIAGNVTRGGTYPLCVGAERALQARETARAARAIGADAVAHGSTAAGNDQIRFDVALRCYAPGLEVIAPIRDLAPLRVTQVEDLKNGGFPVPSHGAAYSVNSGLWGVTIGGTETTTSHESIPEEAWVLTRGAFQQPREPERVTLSFVSGAPAALNGKKMTPVALIEALDALAASFGIGRGIHMGETILGIKGRVAYEAPAATVILQAHRELEKLVLTKRQATVKDVVAQSYGEMVHEGLLPDPACRDIEQLLLSSQKRVTGAVHLLLRPGSCFVEGVDSPHSLHGAGKAVYGESLGDWTPQDASGFSKLYGLSAVLHHKVGERQ